MGEIRDVQRGAESYWMHEYLLQKKMAEELACTVVNHLNGGVLVELDQLVMRMKLNSPEKWPLGTRLIVQIDQVDVKRSQVKLSLVRVVDND